MKRNEKMNQKWKRKHEKELKKMRKVKKKTEKWKKWKNEKASGFFDLLEFSHVSQKLLQKLFILTSLGLPSGLP